MFKRTKTIILSLGLVLALTACSPKPSGQEASPSHPSYSNLNSPSSLEEVRSLLSAHLDKDSVEEFLKLVKDYNSPRRTTMCPRLTRSGMSRRGILSGQIAVLTAIP